MYKKKKVNELLSVHKYTIDMQNGCFLMTNGIEIIVIINIKSIPAKHNYAVLFHNSDWYH